LAIEVQCEKCGQSLRAGPAMLGKKARCPKCGAAVLIKAADDGTTDDSAADAAKATGKKSAGKAKKKEAADPAAGWFVRADDGEFGPVEKSELDEWADEGRLDAECEVRSESWPADKWKSAVSVYPQLAGGGNTATSPEESSDEDGDDDDGDGDFDLAPLDDQNAAESQAAVKNASADEDNPFAALEAADLDTEEISIGDLGFNVKSSKGKRRTSKKSEPAATLADDEIGVAQPGALEDVLGSGLDSADLDSADLDGALQETPAVSPVRLTSATSAGATGALGNIADTADQMHASVQAVAFLTLGSCALAAIVGVFWLARSAPAGLWAFTIAGASLIVIAVFAGLAAKHLLKYVERIDTFADSVGSKDLARQMTAAKKFWAAAMIAVVVALVLAVISLLAFALVPVEQKTDKGKKKKGAQAAVFFEESLFDNVLANTTSRKTVTRCDSSSC
jgi:DNA-directed RNA polymerase subunit RPC12/RpoP